MTTAAELVQRAKSRIQNLSVEEFERELAAGEALVVDLREPEEVKENGRIPGSVHVPRGMLEFRADPSSTYHLEPFQPDRRVLLHCSAGGRSALGAVALQELGYTNVGHLEGGMQAWTKAERPIER
ncbi:MAG: rhodanese-like domain-containing protein [Tepidiformaceae bacterium]